jgi:Fic/DOC family
VATPNELLANSLEIMRAVQKEGIVRSHDISKTHRDRLIKNGFLREICQGWMFVADPSLAKGSSTLWYISYWAFIRKYLEERFGDEYCLSAEASLKIHVGSTLIPSQLIASTKKNVTQKLSLPFDISLLIYPDKKNFPEGREKVSGLWIMDLPTALCRLQPASFKNDRMDTELALRMIGDASALLRILLEGGKTAVAGRLAGAYSFLGEDGMADRIVGGMEAAGYPKVRLTNPFEDNTPIFASGTRVVSPYVSRIHAMWEAMRQDVIQIFPKAPGLPADPDNYLKKVEETYKDDAYNSLSIEGYQISAELIQKVRDGQWDPESTEDRQQTNALVAKGYSLAFKSVEASIKRLLAGDNPGEVVDVGHHGWYENMFSPLVQAGILKPSDLAGYRNGQVYIKESMHVPPPREAVLDSMDEYFKLLKNENDAGVRAVLGHFVFVFIHPYLDGNGRMGRFLMNAMLASGGYPWTVIRMERRSAYMSALEEASVNKNIRLFAEFIAGEMRLTDKKMDSA